MRRRGSDPGMALMRPAARARAVYEDSAIVYPNQPTLNTGGCPYRAATYRPSYMKSLTPNAECGPRLMPAALCLACQHYSA